MPYLSRSELEAFGFHAIGEAVLISDKASIYGAPKIKIGSNVRIDDFCILSAGSGGIDVGSHVHIACYTSLIGEAKITVADYANLSSRVSIYSSNDDYTGATMTSPMIPRQLKRLDERPVEIGRHAIIGAGSVVLPGVVVGLGAAVGALSLVNASCEPFTIYAGVPARPLKRRQKDLLALEAKFERSNQH